jgi:hypothetical protein
VTRTHGRGLPSHVLQKEVKSRTAQDAVRGTVKVALLKNDPEVPNVIACSVYDTKPVHFLTTVAPKVDWIVKERKVWSKAKLSNIHIKFFRLIWLMTTTREWAMLMLQISFVYNTGRINGCVSENGGGPFLFGESELQQLMHIFCIIRFMKEKRKIINKTFHENSLILSFCHR